MKTGMGGFMALSPFGEWIGLHSLALGKARDALGESVLGDQLDRRTRSFGLVEKVA